MPQKLTLATALEVNMNLNLSCLFIILKHATSHLRLCWPVSSWYAMVRQSITHHLVFLGHAGAASEGGWARPPPKGSDGLKHLYRDFPKKHGQLTPATAPELFEYLGSASEPERE